MLPATTIVAIARAMSTGGKLVVVRIPHDRIIPLPDGEEDGMQVVHARCCGLDVHKKSVVACVLLTEPSGPPQREVRTFGTFTHELLALADWLAEQQVTHIALESTGVYWKPIWNLLEDRFALLLVNP